MPRVTFTPNLQRHVLLPNREVPGDTVAEVLEAVFADEPRARGYVLDEHGSLRKHMAIFISGRMIADRERLSDPVEPDAEIFVMQALSGG